MVRYQRELQRAKFKLRHWRYYESHIQELQHYAKVSALTFFKGLKQLEPEEVNWLAERYYKSTQGCNFDELLGDYSTFKPVPFEEVAKIFNRPVDVVQNELKRIERKLGAFVLDYHDQIEQEEAKSNLDKLKKITLDKLDSFEERAILGKAFREIELLRISKQTRNNTKQDTDFC
ncbi:hypothetical protein [Enterococcus sp. AZ177]|uniref:hypothetical protein n=1 Tax=unclassified Enterococcus TaxID=2608891 RepID=UPI003D2FAA48